MRNTILTALFSAAALIAPGAASAFDGGYGYGYGIGIGGLYRSLDYPTENRVPYFASRPPVYYSVPVPRTYGHSPFAYPPHFRTPDLECGTQPIEIVNPYATPSSSSKGIEKAPEHTEKTISARKPAVVKPLVIINPFVEQQQRDERVY
ncbi:MAG: hypothetical protein ACRCT8_00920 [Lacipirellulaceae bacterium]